MRSAPETFERKKDAERWLTLTEAAMARHEWVDPTRAKVRLGDYAARWIEQRAGLRPRTVQLYRWTLKKHIDPYLGGVPLGRLDTPMIREWRAKLLSEGVSSGMVAKAYRLMRAVLWTAVNEDELLVRNPCRVKGADKETPEERPTLSLDQVLALMDELPHRFRLMVAVAAFGSLRFGEVTALERRDIDVRVSVVRVRQQYLEVTGRGLVLGPPKSRAGIRTVALPSSLSVPLRAHLNEYVDARPDGLVFTRPGGSPVRRGGFNKLVSWPAAVKAIGMPGLHFHDLRHTGNMLAAGSKVTTRDLMARMGHDSMAAALIYQHASQEADRSIADHIDAQMVDAATEEGGESDEGDDAEETA